MNVYFISGLGADRKAFERIRLSDNYSIHYLDWIEPLDNETLNEYAKRLAAGIDTSQPFSIVGLSMGGMMASVMTTFLNPHRTILISSIGCNKEFPLLLKFSLKTRAHKIIPGFLFRPKNLFFIQFYAQRLMGTKLKGQKALIRYFVLQSNPQFIRWAINAIINWQDCERPPGIFQIHGSHDRMFPVKYTKPDFVIDKGTHFMVFTKGPEVSKALEKALA